MSPSSDLLRATLTVGGRSVTFTEVEAVEENRRTLIYGGSYLYRVSIRFSDSVSTPLLIPAAYEALRRIGADVYGDPVILALERAGIAICAEYFFDLEAFLP